MTYARPARRPGNRRDARRKTLDARNKSSFGARWAVSESRDAVLDETASQRGEHPLHLFELGNDRTNGFFGCHLQEGGDEKVRLQLSGRAEGDVYEPTELAASETAASLGDVRRYRNGGPPTLRNEPVSLGGRKRGSYLIDPVDNHSASLPDFELKKVLHPPLVQGIQVEGNTPRASAHPPSGTANPFAMSKRSSVWRLASSLPYPSLNSDTSLRTRAPDVWRLASSVPSRSSTDTP